MAIGTAITIAFTYYFTPKYTRVGYMPTQPVAFEHAIHVTQLGLDCRYCHFAVETSSVAGIPPTQTCMNCHSQIRKDSPKLEAVRQSWQTGEPIHWIRIHRAPDFVYFNHSVHVNRGISCVSCHGHINHMRTVWHDQPQSMSWCLDCHRHPEKNIRPLDKVYDLDWKPEGVSQEQMGEKLVRDWGIDPPKTCAGCHR